MNSSHGTYTPREKVRKLCEEMVVNESRLEQDFCARPIRLEMCSSNKTSFGKHLPCILNFVLDEHLRKEEKKCFSYFVDAYLSIGSWIH